MEHDHASNNSLGGIDPLPHPIAINSFSFVLFLLYSTITLVVVFQIGRIIYYRHNLFHYQFLFLIYCLSWGVLRSVFWLLIPWTSNQELFLQGFSIQVQFWTFTLVVLFYMQMIHKIQKNWAEYRTRCFLFYLGINFLFFFGFIASSSLTYFYPLEADTYWIDAAEAFFISIMYLALALLLSFFGWRLVYLIMTNSVQVPFLKNKSRVIILTVILVLIFTSRSVRDLLAGFNIGNISLNDPMGLPIELQVGAFLVMFIWELIPAVIVIFLFWHIPHTAEVPAFPNTATPPVQFMNMPINSPTDEYAEVSGLLGVPAMPTVLSQTTTPNSPYLQHHTSLNSDSYAWSGSNHNWSQRVPPSVPAFQKFQGYSTSSPLKKNSTVLDSSDSDSD
eukprot:TRINITY_DN7131_c0_g1_i1.p1 TRINITY_DN7131_c0_g1~~TRINITY_DN7131_c0_g1_i1.p1  ORF type:complete len:390 (+),score=31.63 TRINITY_DN7131_c0_g1_i1:31-1200(+)